MFGTGTRVGRNTVDAGRLRRRAHGHRLGALVLVPAVLVGLGGCGSSKSSPSETELIAKAKPSVYNVLDKIGDHEVGGTAFVINAAKGLLLTNAHVVSEASSVRVLSSTHSETPVKVIATAPCDDLAVLQLEPPPAGLKALTLSTAPLQLGEKVTVLGYPETLASGEPLGATQGIVSVADAAAAPEPGGIKYPHVVQHTAPVNHGNSGGPLLDPEGNVVGINTLTGATPGGQSQGQYYSITAAHAKELLPKLESGQSVGRLGWTLVPIQSVPTEELEKIFGSEFEKIKEFLEENNITEGLLVASVEAGGAAAETGFTPGDYLTGVQGSAVTSLADVCADVESATRGSKISVDGRYLVSPPGEHQVGESFHGELTVK
jgi:S1-C subfamily serine protease